MADYNTIRRPATTAQGAAVYDEGLMAYMNRVYGIMTVGMLVTAVVAWGFAQMAGGPGAWTEFGRVIYTTPVRWVIMLLPLVMVFAFGAAMRRLSVQGATLLFYAFAAAMGASISSIFLRYTGSSIALTFVATAAGFAFDNELGPHEVELAPFSIARAPVTWDAYLPFIEAGAYDNERLWSADGWAWRQAHSPGQPRAAMNMAVTVVHSSKEMTLGLVSDR